MHLVIMAAGEGSRMWPLTDTTPKPLIKICGKTIIEHNIEHIVDHFDEIYIIVKYRKHDFVEYFGTHYRWKPIHYVEQIETNGTGAAILSLERRINGSFVVVSWDDLYDGDDILNLAQLEGYGTLCKAVANPENFGIFTRNNSGKPIGIVEKPTNPTLGNLANIGVHKFDSAIFPLLRNIPLSSRWELEITDLIHIYIEHGGYSIVEAIGRWIPVWYPWDLLTANDFIIGNYTESINKWATIEPNVTIKWNVYLEEGVILKSGTYIEGNAYFGKNAVIWPNSYIRGNTSIWAESKIGSFVECKNTYLGDHSAIPHLSYMGDSIIGNNVNIGAGSKVANLRHDHTNIRVMMKGKLIDSGRKKLGVVIGDGSRLGINTSIYPGRIIPSNWATLPGEIVR